MGEDRPRRRPPNAHRGSLCAQLPDRGVQWRMCGALGEPAREHRSAATRSCSLTAPFAPQRRDAHDGGNEAVANQEKGAERGPAAASGPIPWCTETPVKASPPPHTALPFCPSLNPPQAFNDEMKDMLKELTGQENLLLNGSDLFLVLDASGVVTYCSASVPSILFHAVEEIENQFLALYARPSSRAVLATVLHQAQHTAATQPLHLRLWRPDGALVHLEGVVGRRSLSPICTTDHPTARSVASKLAQMPPPTGGVPSGPRPRPQRCLCYPRAASLTPPPPSNAPRPPQVARHPTATTSSRSCCGSPTRPLPSPRQRRLCRRRSSGCNRRTPKRQPGSHRAW